MKAIFFDIDDTLYSTSDFARRARENSLRAMINLGLKLPLNTLVKELNEVISEFSSNYEHHFDKLLVRIPSRYYQSINPTTLVAAAVIAYHQTKSKELKPYPDALKALKALARTDLLRGVISDGLTIKQMEKLLRLGIYPLFSPGAIFISEQVGINKPNPKLYQRICSELTLMPQDIMYVGDNPLLDIDPANKIGMITVLFRRSKKYLAVKGKTKPRYQIDNFNQLLNILKTLMK
ncbi:MAG: HAD-IA family hydrolase [Planctomycetes bacterium]|nr:HAD-IA family hydrolase [Planctomycetota bacterium]